MDAVSYSHADKQKQRIEKVIASPDSTSGIVTVPSTIAVGETITIPTGRTAVLPNVTVDGTLVVNGEVFVPAGGSITDTSVKLLNSGFTTTLQSGTLSGDVVHTLPSTSSILVPTASPEFTGTPTVNGVPFSGYSGFKNYIINGGFNVWQRGISFPSASTNTFYPDRWNVAVNGTFTANITQGYQDIVNNTLVKSLSIEVISSNGTFIDISQKIENVMQFTGKTITLTFYTISDVDNSMEIYIGTHYNDTLGTTYGAPIVTTLGTSLKKHTITYEVPVYNSETYSGDNNSYLQILIRSYKTTGAMRLMQVQLEEGSVATPFENRPYGLELSLCQRYYEVGNCVVNSTGAAASFTTFSNRKRVTPTITLTGSGSVSTAYMNGFASNKTTASVETFTASAEL